MLLPRTLVALLAIGAQAGVGYILPEESTSSNAIADARLKEMAMASIRGRGYLQTRQSTGVGSNTPLRPDGSIDMARWDEAANSACRQALRSLPFSSNPSGACVCYNLPALNNVTGAFEADLRLFQRSEPTGDFQGLPQEDIRVSLSYTGASATEISREAAEQMAVVAPAGRVSARQETGDFPLLQSYLFIGQVDKDRMSDGVTMAELQALVMPVVTLSATNRAGQTVSTRVSSNEAAFVAGVFSQEVVMSSYRMAELAVEREQASLKNGTTAFVLPGVQIMIFPVGLIITSIWMMAGFVAYGMGTYARYTFREQHRARMARVEKGGMPRI